MATNARFGGHSSNELRSPSVNFLSATLLIALRAAIRIVIAPTMLVVVSCHKESPPPPATTVERVEQVSQEVVVVPTPQALLVVGSTPPTGGDLLLSNRLSTNLGYAVTSVTGSAATSASANGKALVVISESVTDTQVNTKFKAVTAPVVVLEPLLFDDMSMTLGTTSDLGTMTGQTQVAITNATHPMAAGLTGNVPVGTSGQTFGWGRPVTGATSIANIIGNSARTTIFGYTTGTTMASSFVAPARRVGWFASAAAMNVFNSNGWALFEAATKWATQPEALLVTASTTLTTGETALRTRLQGATLNMGVRVQTAAAVTAANAVPAQLIVISDTVSASTLGTKLTTVAEPILSLSAATFGAPSTGNLQLTGPTSGTDFGTSASQSQINIAKPGHPLAGGLTNSITLVTPAQTFQWGSSIASGAVKVATIVGNTGRAAIFGYPKGALLKNNVAAPARRVGFWASTAALAGSVPSANAWTLFDAAVNWAKNPGVDSVCESKIDGTACDDGNQCTQTDTCQNQVCVGSNPKSCSTPDQCHVAGMCNPANGACPNAQNGQTCNDGEPCTTGEACQAGVCAGGTIVSCTTDTCHTIGACVTGSGCPAPVAKANGATCNDGNPCTAGEVCQAGNCVNGATVMCPGADQCHTVGACLPTGCPAPTTKRDGTFCNDGNACTTYDVCQAGTCAGSTLPTCDGTPKATVEDLGTFGGNLGAGYGINDSRVTVGYGLDPTSKYQAARWFDNDSTIHLVSTDPQADTSSAHAINNAGVIAGRIGINILCRFSAAGVVDRFAPATAFGYALAINDSNSVAGFDVNEAFLYTDQGGYRLLGLIPGQIRTLGFGIDNQNNVVGDSILPGSHFIWDNSVAFRYIFAEGRLQDLNHDFAPPGWILRTARGTNGDEIVGFAEHEQNVQAYRLNVAKNQIDDLGTLVAGSISQAFAINVEGSVAGSAYVNQPLADIRAFVWTERLGMVQLDKAIAAPDHWVLRNAYALNGHGDVVGEGFHDGNWRGFRVHMPELATARVPRCTINSDCATGFCSEGVCCDSTCTGSCVSCRVPGKFGVCSPKLTGTVCDDNNLCNGRSTCDGSGSCQFASGPVQCSAVDSCHQAGICDPSTGTCSNPVLADGTTCTDGNACTQSDTCQGGTCIGANPVTCDAPAQCRLAGTCDSTSGSCSYPSQPDSTPCDDQDTCTTGETCQAGTCTSPPDNGTPCTAQLPTTLVPTETIDSSGATVGATPANFSVTQDGAASYVAKLWSPPGRGVQPNMALVYSSRFGESIVGFGWQLTGLSQIARCRKTAAQDVNAAPIDFGVNGALCLDGTRLAPVGGNEFRPENDKFVRVVTDASRSSFTLYQRDGRVLTYGQNTGKMTGPRSTWDESLPTPGGTEQATYAWALESVKDRIGNEMTIEYETRHSVGGLDTELLPRTIRYSPGRRIEIRYDDDSDALQPGGDHPVPSYHFASGFGLLSSRVVTRLRMYGPDPVDTDLLREYRLAYKMKATLTERPLLTSLQECDRDGVCLGPTTFGWEEGTASFDDVPIPDTAISPPDAVPNIRPGLIGAAVVDLDGDGRDDISLWGILGANGYRLSQRQGSFSSASPGVGQGTVPQDSQQSVRPIDLFMDGHHELLHDTGCCLPEFYRLNRSGTSQTLERMDVPTLGSKVEFVADLNGDGLPDLLDANTGGELRYQLNLGAGQFADTVSASEFVTVTNPSPHIEQRFYDSGQQFPSYVGDFDATGRNAIVFRNTYSTSPTNVDDSHFRILRLETQIAPGSPGFPLSTATGHTVLTPLPSADKTVNGFYYLFVDINGDGNADAIRIPNAGGVLQLALNNGSNFYDLHPQPQLSPVDRISGDTRVQDGYATGIQIADINEDGLADIVVLGAQSGPRAYLSQRNLGLREVSLVNAAGQNLSAAAAIGSTDRNIERPGFPFSQALDVNGDGLMDFIQSVNGQLHLFVHRGKQADQIKSITDGQGKAYTIDYRSIQADDLHGQTLYDTHFEDCTYPQFCTRRGMWLVASYSVTGDTDSNPLSIGRTRTMSYTYANAVTDVRGRGFVAMGSRRELDEQTGTAVLTIADTSKSAIAQSPYPLAGMILKQVVATPIDAAAQTYRVVVTNNDYSVIPFQPASTTAPAQLPFNVRLQKTERIVTDTALLDGTAPPEDIDVVRAIKGGPIAPWVIPTRSIQLSRVTTTYDSYDPFDNLMQSTTTSATASGNEVQVYRGTYANQPGDTSNPTTYILGMPTRTEVTSVTPAGEPKTRVVTYVPNQQTGLVDSMTVQPDTPIAEETLTTAYERNAFGQVKKITRTATNPLDSTPTQRFETFGYDDGDGVFPSSTTNAKLQTTQTIYHPGIGVLALKRDPNQVNTIFQYDGFGRLRSSTTDGQGQTTIHYLKPAAIAGLFTQTGVIAIHTEIHTEQDGGPSETTFYNELGHPYVILARSAETRDSVVETKYTGVVDGQVASVTRPFYLNTNVSSVRQLTTFDYDALGRRLHAVLPNDSTTIYTYSGLSQTTTDPRGNRTTTLFDELGRVTSVTEALDPAPPPNFAKPSVQTAYLYGPFNTVRQINIQHVENVFGGTSTTQLRTTTMTYDDLGRRKTLNDPESGASDRTYNAFGEVVREQMGDPSTMPASQIERITYIRDPLGRVISEMPSSESPSTFTWDTGPFGVGRLAGSTSSDGTVRGYSYDQNGRLQQERWTIDDATNPYVVDYAYDGVGRLERVKYPTVSGRARFVTSYHYDPRGVADAVCDARTTPTAPCTPSSVLALWKATARLADGQISDEVFANGEITHRDYVDPRGLVTLIKTTLGGFPTQFLTYDYDLNGNLQTRGGFAAGPNETFTYDPLNRLTKVSRTDRSSTFTYDDLGNFLSRANKDGQNNPTSQLDYSFTAGATPHPDLVVSGTRYAFDGKGRNTMIGPSSAPQREVAYTPFDLPRQISVGGGAQQWLFHYDADHHRVQKIGDASNNSVTVGDWYEKNLDVEGLNHIFYVHGPERVVAQLKVDSSGHDQFFYLHDDHLGSVETMTDQGGFTNTFSYDAFGTRSPSQSLDLHKGFTFHSHDDDITAQADDPGLIDMKGRMYDPKIGRFTSADPFVAAPLLGQSYNRYAYVLNNPLKYLDPSGFQEEPPSFFGRVWRAITGGGSKSSAAPASNQSAPSGQQGGSSGADLENNQGFIIARAQAEGFRREAGKQTSANSPAGGTGSTSAPVQDGAGSHSTPMGGQGSGSGSPGPGNAPVGGPGTASPGGAGGVDPRGNAEGPGQGPTSGGGPGETGGGGPGGGGYSIPQGNWERRVLGNPARPDGYWGRVSNDWLAANRIVPGAMAPPFAAGYTGISGKIAQMLGLQTPLQVVGSLAGSMGEGALAIGGAAEAAGGGFFTVVGAGASGAGMGFTAAGGWTAVAGGVGVGAAGFVLSGLAWEGGLFVGSLGTGFLH